MPVLGVIEDDGPRSKNKGDDGMVELLPRLSANSKFGSVETIYF